MRSVEVAAALARGLLLQRLVVEVVRVQPALLAADRKHRSHVVTISTYINIDKHQYMSVGDARPE